MVITNEDESELRETVYLAAFLAVSGVALYKVGKFAGRIAQHREHMRKTEKPES